MAIKTYSIKKDGNTNLSANFKVREFRCKDGSDKVLISDDLVKLLQKIRDYFGKPVTLNSAYRNATYNAKIGGASKSQHVNGNAADIVVKGIKPEDVAKYAEYIMPKTGGIGLYPTFTHVDVRTNRSRWKNFGKEVGVSGFPGHKQMRFETPEEVLTELCRRGIITDKELWKTKLKEDENSLALAVKCANQTKDRKEEKSLISVSDIVTELNKMGIMDSKELWLDKLTKDTPAYWLARKIAFMTDAK